MTWTTSEKRAEFGKASEATPRGARIPLSNGGFALADPEDAEHLLGFAWRTHPGGYANRKDGNSSIPMHRDVLGLGSVRQNGLFVVHLNYDLLDNRKANLRVTTQAGVVIHQPPMRTSSGGQRKASAYKGVRRKNRRWKAILQVNGRARYLGSYETEDEAARAYDEAAYAAYGDIAYLNRPDDLRPVGLAKEERKG